MGLKCKRIKLFEEILWQFYFLVLCSQVFSLVLGGLMLLFLDVTCIRDVQTNIWTVLGGLNF